MNQLEISKLNKIYDNGTHALKDLDLEVKKGEFLILLGLSGSGKSTLLRCINRLVEPTSGVIKIGNEEVTKLSSSDLRKTRSKIGMIFQQFNLIKNLSAELNVCSGVLGRVSTLSSIFIKRNEIIIQEAHENLKKVGLFDFRNQKASEMSGGQQQRVAIARALMQNPELILADEPVASLDPATSDSVMQYLGELNKNENLTVICSLHFLSLARKYGTRVVALKDGKIVFDGSPSEIDEVRFKEIYGEDAQEVEIR